MPESKGHTPAPSSETVRELIADIEARVHGLTPLRPEPFYSEVAELSSTVGKLHRIAQWAVEATQVPEPAPQPRRARTNVTPIRATTVVDEPPEADTGGPGEDSATIAAVRSGDEWSFAEVVERYRRELQVHCYRMVGSFDDSEDLVQETLLRAWRRREAFEGRSTFRAWLYRIATNVCLDFLRSNTRKARRYDPPPGAESTATEPPARITWLQPYPDEFMEDAAPSEAEPESAAVSRETIELVFLAAIQHLPPRQRAVLILRDVLGWPASESAALLEMSVASVNSALQRARPTLRKHLPERRLEWTRSTDQTEQEHQILQRYMAAAERDDISGMAELLSEDALLTMPPDPLWLMGRDAIIDFVSPTFDRRSTQYFGNWRHVPTRANRQPAAAAYVRRPGTTVYRAQVLDVLRIADGQIVEITSFEPHLFPAFGLPLTL